MSLENFFSNTIKKIISSPRERQLMQSEPRHDRQFADDYPYPECDCGEWEFSILRSAESGDPHLMCPVCERIYEVTLALKDR